MCSVWSGFLCVGNGEGIIIIKGWRKVRSFFGKGSKALDVVSESGELGTWERHPLQFILWFCKGSGE